MRSYFIRNRFHFDMHAAYVIIRKSGGIRMYICVCIYSGTQSAWLATTAATVTTATAATASILAWYALMMWWWWWYILLLAAWFSLSHCFCPVFPHLAMASMRIILLSTISQPQNETQRKTHFRAHFIMKIHIYTIDVYVCMYCALYCVYIFTWNCELTRWKSVEKAWIWNFTVIREMCVEHMANLSLLLWISSIFVLFHILFDTHGRHWMTLAPPLSLSVPEKVTTWAACTTTTPTTTTKYEFEPYNSTFDIQHAYAHIFMLIIKKRKQKTSA